jgi:hypothetical protein
MVELHHISDDLYRILFTFLYHVFIMVLNIQMAFIIHI